MSVLAIHVISNNNDLDDVCMHWFTVDKPVQLLER